MRLAAFFWLLAVALRSAAAGDPAGGGPDRLAAALAAAGLQRQDLGYRLQAYWSPLPDPERIAYSLPFCSGLLGEPLRAYEFARTMAMAAAARLDPDSLAADEQALYRLAFHLGVERKIAGLRPHGANLPADPAAAVALSEAVERLEQVAGRPPAAGVPDPRRRGRDRAPREERLELARQATTLSPPLQRALAALLVNVADAYEWRQQAVRRCPAAAMQQAFANRRLATPEDEPRAYWFEIDDVARELDEPCLYYACLKAVQAADQARRAFAAAIAADPAGASSARFELRTAAGRIVVRGTGPDVHAWPDAAVLVDLGGDDHYLGAAGATPSLAVPISIAIDCAGDDRYEQDGDEPAQGAGFLGAGILIDAAGNDAYRGRRHAQGCGVFGLGLLFDGQGDDQYWLDFSGQGAGYFGLGLLLDGGGQDAYRVLGDGQGFGGPGGVGVLAERAGDDRYTAEARAEQGGRPDYHSHGRIACSYAQGAGAGRRGDIAEGHTWAGGLGALLDLDGDDQYEAGNFSMGLGYTYGTGILYDGAGDDRYRSVYFTQGSAAHFGVGALIDAGGDDRHELYDTGGAGLGYGWDFAIGLLVQLGGSDSYRLRSTGLGRAEARANGLFFDLGGDDEYICPAGPAGLGAAPCRDEYRRPGYARAPDVQRAKAIGLFLDIGGRDRYRRWAGGSDPGAGATVPDSAAGDDRTWLQPAPDSSEYGAGNHGIGMDAATGVVPEFAAPPPPPPLAPGAGSQD